jgi:hypothetical protein
LITKLFADVCVDIRRIIGTYYALRTDRSYQYKKSNITEAHKHVHTRFKPLHNPTLALRIANLLEKRQTAAQTVKLLHKQSNHTTHDQTVCATAGVVQTV